MESLLTDINQAGLGRGLQFELFKPATQENKSEFYSELPISIRVTGNYHDIGAFASDVAKLSRIVLLSDITLTPKDGILAMDATAKTYRYLDEDELAQQKKAAKAKKAPQGESGK
jgi:type IV pilus assembly protein PilO